MIRGLSFVCLCLLVSACGGSPSGIQGEYLGTDDHHIDTAGTTSLNLEGRRTARLQSAGAEFSGRYSLDGSQVKLELEGLPPISLLNQGNILVPVTESPLVTATLGRVGGMHGRYTHDSGYHGRLVVTLELDGTFEMVATDDGDAIRMSGRYHFTDPYGLHLHVVSEPDQALVIVDIDDEGALEIARMYEAGQRGGYSPRAHGAPLILRR